MNIKVRERIQRMATKGVEKTLGKALRKMTLPQQVSFARKVLRTKGIINFRHDFLQESGFPDDIRDLLKEGKTPEEVKAYYWGCPEFQVFWEELELTEYQLEWQIEQAKKGG